MFASQRNFSSARGGKSGRGLFLVVQRHFLHNNKRLNVEFFNMFASLNQQLDLYRVGPKTNAFIIQKLYSKGKMAKVVVCCLLLLQLFSNTFDKTTEANLE